MIQSLNRIKARIKSIENTKKTMRAMEMVSAAKMKRIESAYNALRPFYKELDGIFNRVICGMENPTHPLLLRRNGEGPVALCVIASDTGLCGTYNEIVLRHAYQFIMERGPDMVRIFPIGQKALNYFKKRGLPVSNSYVCAFGRYSHALCDDIVKMLIGLYMSGSVSEVYIGYMHFESLMRHTPRIDKLLDISCEKSQAINYIAEPDIATITDELIPRYLSTKMRMIFLDAFYSEHSARMLAMKSATDNSKELLDVLTVIRNKARQSMITKEVIEISTAAEALKG